MSMKPMLIDRAGLMATVIAVAGLAAPAVADHHKTSPDGSKSGPQAQSQKDGGSQSSASKSKAQSSKSQSASQSKSKSQQQQQASSKKQGQKKQVGEVSGRLVGLKAARLKGESQPHILAKLTTQSGKTLVVDLGTREDIGTMRFRPNQQLTVRGPAGRINGKPILVADKVRDDSRKDRPTVTIVRLIPFNAGPTAQPSAQGRNQQQQQQMSQQRQSQQQQQQQAARMISGKVADKREVTVRHAGGESHKHMMVKLEGPGGRTAMVDLGPANGSALKNVKLKSGQFLSALGQIGRVNGQPVFVADHVAEVMKIDRSQDGQGDAEAASAQTGGQQSQSKSSQDKKQSQQDDSGQGTN